MKKGKTLRDFIRSAARTNDWNVPNWNTPMAQDFIEAQKRVTAVFARLNEIEAALDEREKQLVNAEFGEGHEPTPTRLANARFQSTEWRQAWQEFMQSVSNAQELAQKCGQK